MAKAGRLLYCLLCGPAWTEQPTHRAALVGFNRDLSALLMALCFDATPPSAAQVIFASATVNIHLVGVTHSAPTLPHSLIDVAGSADGVVPGESRAGTRSAGAGPHAKRCVVTAALLTVQSRRSPLPRPS